MADLPREILLEIFARSSAKCVGRCRTLSKYWNSHLSTTDFIKKHLISRQEIDTHLAIVTLAKDVYTISPPIEAIVTQRKSIDYVPRIEVESCLPSKWSCIRGSCDGLILLDGEEGKMLLVNPVTRKQLVIQPPQVFEVFWHCTVHGLGYDSRSDDYKIVQVVQTRAFLEPIGPAFVDVYSVKNDVWKRVDGCYPYGELHPLKYGYEGGAFLNGAVHWIIGKNFYHSCITAFDLANEVFSDIPLPQEFVRQLSHDTKGVALGWRPCGLSVIGGCLSIVDGHGDIWIMEEYGVPESWVRFRITNVEEDGQSIATTLSYVEDGELLCLTRFTCFVVCDLKEGKAKEVSVSGFDFCIKHGITFVDTLVSPDRSW